MDGDSEPFIQFEQKRLAGGWDWNVSQDRLVMCGSLSFLHGLTKKTSPTSFKMMELLTAIHPGDRDRIETGISQAVVDGSIFEAVYRVVDGGSNIRWLSLKGRCHYDAEGRPVQVTGFGTEYVPLQTTLHDTIFHHLIQAHTGAVAGEENMLTKLIEAVMLEAAIGLADARGGLKDGRA